MKWLDRHRVDTLTQKEERLMVPKKVWILTGQIPLDFRALDSSLAQCYVHPVSLWMQWQFCQPLNCLWGCLPFLSRIIHVCIQIALLVCPRSLIEVVVLVAQSNPTLWPHGLSEGLPLVHLLSFLFQDGYSQKHCWPPMEFTRVQAIRQEGPLQTIPGLSHLHFWLLRWSIGSVVVLPHAWYSLQNILSHFLQDR